MWRAELSAKTRKVWRILEGFCDGAVYLKGNLEVRTDDDLKRRMP